VWRRFLLHVNISIYSSNSYANTSTHLISKKFFQVIKLLLPFWSSSFLFCKSFPNGIGDFPWTILWCDALSTKYITDGSYHIFTNFWQTNLLFKTVRCIKSHTIVDCCWCYRSTVLILASKVFEGVGDFSVFLGNPKQPGT
jgi:hypothetical protein